MKVIQVQTEDGQVIFIEISENIDVVSTTTGGGSIAGDDAVSMILKFEEVGATIADVCRVIHQKVLATIGSAKPKDLSLEFGIKLAGEAGIPLVTKGSVEGTFKVTANRNFDKTN